MFTPFVLFFAAGVGFRLGLARYLRNRFTRKLAVPQTFVSVLLVLSCLPGWLQPVPLPLPFSFLLGAFLPDLVLSGRSS